MSDSKEEIEYKFAYNSVSSLKKLATQWGRKTNLFSQHRTVSPLVAYATTLRVIGRSQSRSQGWKWWSQRKGHKGCPEPQHPNSPLSPEQKLATKEKRGVHFRQSEQPLNSRLEQGENAGGSANHKQGCGQRRGCRERRSELEDKAPSTQGENRGGNKSV